MPVEIREIVIRAFVDETPAADKPRPPGEPIDRDELIADCVEQVMQLLRREEER